MKKIQLKLNENFAVDSSIMFSFRYWDDRKLQGIVFFRISGFIVHSVTSQHFNFKYRIMLGENVSIHHIS